MADYEIVTTGAELAATLPAVSTAALDQTGAAALAALPAPEAIEALDYAADLAARLETYAGLVEAAGYDRPDVLDLISTPERIILEESSYREQLLRARINAAYRAGLLYFAEGADLDHVAELAGVARLADEPDADLRHRVRVANRGSSAAGPADWWRAHALSADEGIEDVAVTRPSYPVPAPGETRGSITLSVLAEGVTGEPTAEQLAAVEAVATSPAVRGATSAVTVQAATRTTVDVTAEIWLHADAAASVFEALPAALATAWGGARRLGWSVVESWIHAALMRPGVARVELVGWADVEIGADEAPLLGEITLTRKDAAA